MYNTCIIAVLEIPLRTRRKKKKKTHVKTTASKRCQKQMRLHLVTHPDSSLGVLAWSPCKCKAEQDTIRMKKAAKAKQSESMLPTWNPAVSQSMTVVPPNRCSECNNTTPRSCVHTSPDASQARPQKAELVGTQVRVAPRYGRSSGSLRADRNKRDDDGDGQPGVIPVGPHREATRSCPSHAPSVSP